MSLLNPTFPSIASYTTPTITHYTVSETPSAGILQLQELFDKVNIWYCAFTTPKCFSEYSIKDLMAPEHFQMVMDKKAWIILDLSFEPFLDVIDSIYENIVLAHGIPASHVILLSNLFDAEAYSKEAAAKYQSQPIQTCYFSALEWHINHRQWKVDSKPLEINKAYGKKFINLNRRWRLHRAILTILLYHKNLIAKGYVSFGPCEEHREWTDALWSHITSVVKSNPELSAAVRDSQGIRTMPWLYLDTPELDTNRPGINASTNMYYHDSYFSLVSETTFFTDTPTLNSRFITEKTYKAILMQHPFIIVSVPKTLEALRSLGYKTFSPWINEDYDLELNDIERLSKILKETERLANLTPTELTEFLTNVIPICTYNYQLLINRTQFIGQMKTDTI